MFSKCKFSWAFSMMWAKLADILFKFTITTFDATKWRRKLEGLEIWWPVYFTIAIHSIIDRKWDTMLYWLRSEVTFDLLFNVWPWMTSNSLYQESFKKFECPTVLLSPRRKNFHSNCFKNVIKFSSTINFPSF